MFRAFALPALLLAITPFHSSVAPLSKAQQTRLKAGGYWHKGCPVGLSDLRLLTVTHRNFRGRAATGEIVLNKAAARPVGDAFRRLYALHFPIHHMTFAEVYGPAKGRPADGDLTGSFECRQAVPSPCTGGKGTGTWSNHAYGMAVDVNPVENPYVGCGMSRDPTAQKFRNRSTHRRGMVTPRAVQAFRSSGWGWGGAWTGDTKDYMHFSFNGH